MKAQHVEDLFTFANKDPYEKVYEALKELREVFHREGRINDSNAKLDEIVKLIALHLAAEKGLLKSRGTKLYSTGGLISVEQLQRRFRQAAALPMFKRSDGVSIFGKEPSLALQPGDEEIATRLFELSGICVQSQFSQRSEVPFDMLNEAFGHFVRDTFRNNVEDAQYMTPPEVVAFMVEMALQDISVEFSIHSERREPFVVMDPSCGVGSFLTAFRRTYKHAVHKTDWPELRAIGQDKVDRMLRLSFMNMMLFRNGHDTVVHGNSLIDESEITAYNGKVDLILTNPPFGAKFDRSYITAYSKNSLPIFTQATLSPKSYDSEILFIDRYLSLLREGGRCLVIVPDGVVSAKGIAAYLRQQVARRATLKAVVELPPVTFAQAGTRTKTAVLYFQKNGNLKSNPHTVFFAEADDIGFEVSKRKGVPIKKYVGRNQLPDILEAYKEKAKASLHNDGQPFYCQKEIEPTRLDAWTPRQFRVDHTEVRKRVAGHSTNLVELKELIEYPPQRRRPEKYSDGTLYISVLHIIGEGILDIASVKDYKPVTPGIPVHPGEIIIARINPRIPRILVVPNLGKPLLCSSEFEILRPEKDINPYMIAYQLRSSFVQEQIQALTAGTSASHSRVKPEKLYQVLIPLPKRGTKAGQKLTETIAEYERSLKVIAKALQKVSDCRAKEVIWVP